MDLHLNHDLVINEPIKEPINKKTMMKGKFKNKDDPIVKVFLLKKRKQETENSLDYLCQNDNSHNSNDLISLINQNNWNVQVEEDKGKFLLKTSNLSFDEEIKIRTQLNNIGFELNVYEEDFVYEEDDIESNNSDLDGKSIDYTEEEDSNKDYGDNEDYYINKCNGNYESDDENSNNSYLRKIKRLQKNIQDYHETTNYDEIDNRMDIDDN